MSAEITVSTTTSGRLTVDVLLEASKEASSVYNGEIPAAAYQKIARIPFSPYWGDLLERWREEGSPAKDVAKNIVGTALIEKGTIRLLSVVAKMLAIRYPEDLLKGDPRPSHSQNNGLGVIEPKSLAEYLVTSRAAMEGHGEAVLPRMISDGWIAHARNLFLFNSSQAEVVCEDMRLSYAMVIACTSTPFGFAVLKNTIAIPLASHFPEVVVANLHSPVPPVV